MTSPHWQHFLDKVKEDALSFARIVVAAPTPDDISTTVGAEIVVNGWSLQLSTFRARKHATRIYWHLAARIFPPGRKVYEQDQAFLAKVLTHLAVPEVALLDEPAEVYQTRHYVWETPTATPALVS